MPYFVAFNPFAVHFFHYRFLLPCLVLLVSSATAHSQTFQPVPGAVVTQEVAFNQANEVYLHLDNPSGDTLRLKWRQLEISMPDGWDIDLCDYGTCYVGIPPNGNMVPVYDTIRAYLKLIVQPGATAGAAWCWFRVQDATDATNFNDVYFSLYTPGTSAAAAPGAAALHVFPNPAREAIFVEHTQSRVLPARLTDATGRVVWHDDLTGNGPTRIPVAGFPAGLYFLQTENQTRRVIIAP